MESRRWLLCQTPLGRALGISSRRSTREEPPIDPKSPSLADKLNEVQLMLRSLEVPTSTKNSELDSSQLALQWEFEKLRDVQGILPLSHGLMAEIEDHVNKDGTTSWTHCHNAPAFSFVIRQSPPDKDEVNEEWTSTVKTKSCAVEPD